MRVKYPKRTITKVRLNHGRCSRLFFHIKVWILQTKQNYSVMKKNYFMVNVDSIDFKVYQMRKTKVDGETERFNITDNFKLKKGAHYSSFKLAKIMLYKLGLLYRERVNLDLLLTNEANKAFVPGKTATKVNKKGETVTKELLPKQIKAKSALSLSAPLYFELSWKGVVIDTLHVDSKMKDAIKLSGENPLLRCVMYLTSMLNVALRAMSVNTLTDVDAIYSELGVEFDGLQINESAGLMRQVQELLQGELNVTELQEA